MEMERSLQFFTWHDLIIQQESLFQWEISVEFTPKMLIKIWHYLKMTHLPLRLLLHIKHNGKVWVELSADQDRTIIRLKHYSQKSKSVYKLQLL